MEMEPGGMPLEEEEEETFRDSVTLREPVTEFDGSSSQSSNNVITSTATATGSDPLSIPISMHQFYNRSISSNEDNMSQGLSVCVSCFYKCAHYRDSNSFITRVNVDYRECEHAKLSGWYNVHVQHYSFLQDDLPDGYQLVHEWNVDFSPWHRLIELSTILSVHEPKQYRGAAEFCKMSGLLCSYGLYQVKCLPASTDCERCWT